MKSVAFFASALLLAACTTRLPPADPSTAASTERPVANGEWSDRQIQQDVESSVRERFGDAAFERALAAEASIMSKLYHGMPYPPVQQPDGTWKERPKPVALMLREAGQWKRVTESGVSSAASAEQTELEVLLESVAFWQEPARIAQGGCTDGGSSLFVIRQPQRVPQVRQGTCGGTPLHSRLISAVY